MDYAEHAEHQEQLSRDIALSMRKRVEKRTVGICANCKVLSDPVFCCVECREDWQKRRDSQIRNGK